ncbi:MAG: hypothetical protein MPL62_07750, partial [Alphaproteobacteria bacterium]|nr:hypothetical protein [Alphaproteobacteria bacterium]
MAKKIYRRDIRPSQFVTTYGPGSLLRIGNMSRIMPDIGALVRDLEKLDGFSGLGEFRIYDNKLESTVKGVMELNKEKVDSVKIFRIPTNSDFRLPGNRILYNTELFPKWSICKRHKILCRLDIDENGKDYLPCSKCQNEGLEPDVGTAIRFIQACQNGHMSDINWHGEVWHKKGCNGNEFDWSEDDETFEVVCTQCKQKADYKSIRRKAREGLLKCNRHHAESGITDDDCCEIVDDKRRETGRMLLVNASNLRLAHVISSLIVPPYADRLFKILSQFEIQFLGSCKAVTKQEFLARCQSIIEYTPWLNDEIMMILDESSETKLQNTIRAVLGKQSKNSATEEQSEIDEFKVLLESSENGYPRPHSGEEPDFVVDVNKVRRGITVPGFGFKFTITPISILHVVRTQVGYRREVKS